MIETLFNSDGKDETRVRRAFSWVVTFRDFPVNSWQTVQGSAMMTGALTLFTKGRAEFYLDGVRRGDRLPGILSTEHEVVQTEGEFKLVYVEPTTRLCIPATINNFKIPTVSKFALEEGESIDLQAGNYLVCLGSVDVGKQFTEERTFKLNEQRKLLALSKAFILQFHDSPR